MQELNYRHLLYFWLVVREGSVTRASRLLGVAQPTISAQLRRLESQVGEPLFICRRGKSELTPRGQLMYHYAQQIFQLGQELQQRLFRVEARETTVLRIGCSSSLPWGIRGMLLQRWGRVFPIESWVCEVRDEGRLWGGLLSRQYDVIVLEESTPPVSIETTHQVVIEQRLGWLSQMPLNDGSRRGYPSNLQKQRLILPAEGGWRWKVKQWLIEHRLHPSRFIETNDELWAWQVAQAGWGVIPSALPQEGDWQVLGELKDVLVRCIIWAIPPISTMVETCLQATTRNSAETHASTSPKAAST
ncbi:MAG: LysR family transcriptional regulator [Planctomycetaceae bacterium]|nr:MAG: LysR family transcriptional regulator [Planctomycetaceae bacterium]